MKNLILLICTFFSFQLSYADYCTPYSSRNNDHYIESITVAGNTQTTGQSALSFDNNYTTVFYAGAGLPLEIALQPSNNDTYYFWRIWLDLDQSESFESNEMIAGFGFSGFGISLGVSGEVFGNIQIPADALNGNTKMRIQMFPSSYASSVYNACTILAHGEVEDYTLNVVNDYCGTDGTSTTGNISSFIQKTTINGVTTNSGNNGGFADFTEKSIPTQKSENINFELRGTHPYTTTTPVWKIFIDWNADGDFNDFAEYYYDEGKEVNLSLYTPDFAVAGAIRMRIQYGTIGSDINPCSNYYFGEGEDYTLFVYENNSACQPHINNAYDNYLTSVLLGDVQLEMDYNNGYQKLQDDVSFMLSTFDENIFGFYNTGILDYYGQSSTANQQFFFWIDLNEDGDFEDAGELILQSVTNEGLFTLPTITDPALKRARLQYVEDISTVTPDPCRTIERGDVVDFNVGFIIAIPAFLDPYCEAASDNVNYESIASVEFTAGIYSDLIQYINTEDLASQNHAIVGPSFSMNYTNDIENHINLKITPNFPMGGAYSEHYGVWIDYNRDEDFDEANETIFVSTTGNAGDMNVPFILPSSMESGNYRMRIVMNYDNPPTACGTFTYGQVLDFNINIDVWSLDLSYCEPTANSSEEWINSVEFTSSIGSVFRNESGNDGGYGDYKTIGAPTLSLRSNDVNYFTGTPGYTSMMYGESWDIWIDLNLDGEFTGLGEHVLISDGSVIGAYTSDFFIPSAFTASTTMRVMMSYYDVNDPCGDVAYGEVEDYTVNLINSSTSGLAENENMEIRMDKMVTLESTPRVGDKTSRKVNNTTIFDNNLKTKITNLNVFPSPTTGVSRVTMNLNKIDDAIIQIFNTNGQLIHQQKVEQVELINTQIDITNQVAGNYVVKVQTATGTQTKQIIKIE